MPTDAALRVRLAAAGIPAGVIERADALRKMTGLGLLSQLWSNREVSERLLVQVLADALGSPGIVLGECEIHMKVLRVLPSHFARKHHVVPVGTIDGSLAFACAEPADKALAQQIHGWVGRNAHLFVAIQSAIEFTVLSAYKLLDTDGIDSFFGADANPKKGGLAIVQPAVRGTLSEIELAVELEATTSQVKIPESLRDSPPPNPMILVVDDDSGIREFVASALRENGYQVVTFADGKDAAASLSRPDLVAMVADVMLPGVHGFELAKRVKESGRKLPVILMSAAYRGWEVRKDARERFAVDAYLEKPFSVSDLLTAVREAMGEATIDQSRLERAKRAYADGFRLFRDGKVDAAEEKLHAAVLDDPALTDARLLLASLYGKQMRVFPAIDQLEAIAEQEPKNVPVLLTLGKLYESEGFRNRATSALERALLGASDEASRLRIKEHLSRLLFDRK